MKSDMIFFSPDGHGLTATSANYIANLAKEMIRTEESALDGLVFFSSSVALIGTSASERLTLGSTEEDLATVPDRLHTIAKAKSLIAWLREAIKAKERLCKETDQLLLEEYAKQQKLTLPEKPIKEAALTDDDYYASLSLDERNRYYQTETLAAVLGKAIHPGGSLAEAREALDLHIRQQREVKGEGRDTLIYTFEPTVEQGSVDNIYFKLQKQYREAQAKVNSFKHDCSKAVTASQTLVNADYVSRMNEYNREMGLLEAKLVEYKKLRLAEIEGFRILVPQSLKGIYDKVADLGKKKE